MRKKNYKYKVEFERWLIWSDYTLIVSTAVVSTASLTVTAKADAC